MRELPLQCSSFRSTDQDSVEIVKGQFIIYYKQANLNKCNTSTVITKCIFTRCLQRVLYMGHILYKVHVQVPTYLTRILYLRCRNYINLQLIFQNILININIYATKAVKKIQGVLTGYEKHAKVRYVQYKHAVTT